MLQALLFSNVEEESSSCWAPREAIGEKKREIWIGRVKERDLGSLKLAEKWEKIDRN